MSRHEARGFRWTSKRGNERSHNLDAGGVLIAGGSTVAVVVDCMERQQRKTEYPMEFLRALLESIANRGEAAVAPCLQALQSAHSDLRKKHAGERLCFVMAIFCADDEHVTSIHCGDCRLGHFAQDHQVNWVTRTHSLSAFMGAGEDVVPADDEYRRIVTKSVGVRFPAPEMASHRGNGSSDWVLATDGYWLQGGHFDGSIGHADDKSALIIDWSGDRVVDSDAENFICLG